MTSKKFIHGNFYVNDRKNANKKAFEYLCTKQIINIYQMSKTIIKSHAELEALVGKELGVSDWHTFTQEQINLFADATLDHQWIHVDVDRAKKESTFGNTIAHGYLTLSILPHLWEQIVDVQNIKDQINYGIENFRYQQPVVVNSRVRLQVKVNEVLNLRGTTKATMSVKLEIEGEKKPAYTGDIVFLYHFQ